MSKVSNVYIVFVLFGAVCSQTSTQPFEISVSSQGLDNDATTSIPDLNDVTTSIPNLNNVVTTSNPSGVTDYLDHTDSTDFPVYPDSGASSEASSNENGHRDHGKRHHGGLGVGNRGFESGFGNGRNFGRFGSDRNGEFDGFQLSGQGNSGLGGNLGGSGIFGGGVNEGLNGFGKTGQRDFGGNRGQNLGNVFSTWLFNRNDN